MSFTAGSVVFADQATFTSSGGVPGTGTWSTATTAGSTFADTGTATVIYIPATAMYTATMDYNVPEKTIPGIGKVNDYHIVSVSPLTRISPSSETWYWTLDKQKVGPTKISQDTITLAPPNAGPWAVVGSSGHITGNLYSYQNGFNFSPAIDSIGNFSGVITAAVPEPSSVVLLGVGTTVLLACRMFSSGYRRGRSERRGIGVGVRRQTTPRTPCLTSVSPQSYVVM